MSAYGFRGMSSTVPKCVRVLDGVTDPLGGSRRNLLNARNGISQIPEICNKNIWLPSLDTFRTFAVQNAVCSNLWFLSDQWHTRTTGIPVLTGCPAGIIPEPRENEYLQAENPARAVNATPLSEG